MTKFLSISDAAKLLSVSVSTLRRWEKDGKIQPATRTSGNQRRYDPAQLLPHRDKQSDAKRKTIAYARVSSRDQKSDLDRQAKMLELFCSANGWKFEVIKDLGSGINYRKKGLQSLLKQIVESDVERLVLTHKDRLLRFGAELVFAICELQKVEVVFVNQGDEGSFEEELSKDVLEIITVFSARLYGSRSQKNKKLMAKLEQAVKDDSGT